MKENNKIYFLVIILLLVLILIMEFVIASLINNQNSDYGLATNCVNKEVADNFNSEENEMMNIIYDYIEEMSTKKEFINSKYFKEVYHEKIFPCYCTHSQRHDADRHAADRRFCRRGRRQAMRR